jgi:hypothetical protein
MEPRLHQYYQYSYSVQVLSKEVSWQLMARVLSILAPIFLEHECSIASAVWGLNKGNIFNHLHQIDQSRMPAAVGKGMQRACKSMRLSVSRYSGQA